jgi:MarR family transcriptional regulator, transcriptional regulator for hemolysin
MVYPQEGTCSLYRSVMAVPGAPLPVEGVRADLGWALGVVFRAYVKTVGAALTEIPGGPRGYQVLSAAVHDAPDSQLALAQRLGVDRTVMTYLLDDLTTAGLIARQQDPNDRRARRIVATEQGQVRLCELDRLLRQVEDHVLGGLGEDDRESFRELVQRVALDVTSGEPAESACDVAEDLAVKKAMG